MTGHSYHEHQRPSLTQALKDGKQAAFLEYQEQPDGSLQKRLIEHVRTLYRRDDLSAPLPLGTLESLALPYQSYKQAFTPGLLVQLYGDRLSKAMLEEGRYVHSEGDDNWWIPSGRVFYVSDPHASSMQELAFAREHFFLPQRIEDPFGHTTIVAYDHYDLLAILSRDAIGNEVRAEYDYRVLQPKAVIDPNRNRSEAAFDALGMLVGTAIRGKVQDGQAESGDSLADFVTDLSEEQLHAFVRAPKEMAPQLLGTATTRIIYDLERFKQDAQPVFASTLAREKHVNTPGGTESPIQVSFTYSDGFGREIQSKIQAEPGDAPLRAANTANPEIPGTLILEDGKPVLAPANPRWVGKGRTVYNNKGKPIKQYEPFFSSTHLYEEEAETVITGVTPILFYDPVERVVATVHPNHTYEKVVFDPWLQRTWDVNDTVLQTSPQDDLDVGDYFRRLPETDYLPTWYAQRVDGALGRQEQTAANKAAIHANTPTSAHFDALGRPFLTVAQNRFERDGTIIEKALSTRSNLDIEGNQREVIDARNRIVMHYAYDMLSNHIHQASMEAGARWMLNDVVGKALYAWDSRGHRFHTLYDALHRPIEVHLLSNDGSELLVNRTIYGETLEYPETKNLRGKAYQTFDGAGVLTNDVYDFKGNLLHSSHQLTADYKNTPDWSTQVALEAQIYTSSTSYDALNRPITLTSPDNSVIHPTYNEANLLEGLAGNLRGEANVTTFVRNIDYDAKGQRTLIEYGNGTHTRYDYDPETFRLTHLLTLRGAAFPDDCPQPHKADCGVQNLHYTYDPTGNITSIRDDAQQTIYFHNRRVEPSADYTYDAIYRLIGATGREHLGQAADGDHLSPVPTSSTDKPRVNLPQPGDGNAMGRYFQQYVYDEVGNILRMIHTGTHPANPGWTRSYAYHETSQLEANKTSNRLSSTHIGNQPLEHYAYDIHGNMTNMSHLPLMQWDYRDQLQAISQQTVTNGGTPEITYYVYDANGQRVRKVTERARTGDQAPTCMKERIYLDSFEIYREYGGDGDTVTLERETLHIMDDKQRIALIETRTHGEDESPAQLIRYQFNNHLGSASLELDNQGLIISYEEYYPYGSTSYQAVRSKTETPKRYRYTGKERDEESGLYYHGARYYACWLGRWTSCDPIGLKDGLNLFLYVRCNPITKFDPNGLWETDMHFLGVYWAGRMQGANHVQALIAAIGSQSLDDSEKTSAPGLKLTGQEGAIQLANNSHSLNLTKAESQVVASRGIKEQNVLLFGLGLHTVGDYLPHANLSGAMTGGHQLGYNEDFSTSHDTQHDADYTYKNPQKALATFERFRELWSKYLPHGDQYKPLVAGDANLQAVADFIFTKNDNLSGKEATATKGLKAIGVTEKELSDVLKYYRDPKARIEAMKVMRETIKGGDAIATANGIWLSQKQNSSFFNNMQIKLAPELQGVAKITTKEFEERRSTNLARSQAMFEQFSYVPGVNVPEPIEEVYSPKLPRAR